MRPYTYSNLTSLGIISIFVTLSMILILNFQPAYSKNPEVSYLDLNDTNSVSKFTVAAWFKTSTDYKSDAFIVSKTGDGGNLNYGLWMTDSEKISGGFDTSSGKAMYATSPLSYSDGKWHYAMVTYDGSYVILYVDGAQVAVKKASGSPDTGGSQPVRVGADLQSSGNYFDGNIDEVRVWRVALTPDQALDAANNVFNTKYQELYLDFSKPISMVNQTNGVTNQTGLNQTITQVNATATNETITQVNATSNETITKINGTNETLIQPNANATTNETLIQPNANATTNETLIQPNANATTNETATQHNGTATNETANQGGNKAANNESSAFINSINKNETKNANVTNETIQPIKKPLGKNETGVSNETTIENQTSASSIPMENNLPQAFDQSVTVDQNKHVDITLVADDKDKDQLQFAITADPSHGSLVKFDKDKGTVTYIPEKDYSGDDKFSFRATDINGGQSGPANVDIKVNAVSQAKNETGTANTNQVVTENQTSASALSKENNLPQAFDQSVTVDQNKHVDITLVADDKDKDQLQFAITADPSHGSLVKFDKDKGTVTYIPEKDYSGDDKFSFRATDINGGQSGPANVDIKVNAVSQPNENQTNDNSNTESTKSEVLSNETSSAKTAETNLAEANQPPKADAGDDQKANVNDVVKLDGGKSSDADGKIVSYKWEQIDGPNVNLDKANEQTATFNVPDSAAGSKLSFKLTVTDDKDASSSDDVTVQVEKVADNTAGKTDTSQQTDTTEQTSAASASQVKDNLPPKADAGDDQKAKVNDAVKLDGGKSSDADGKIVSYKWEQTDGPKVDLKNSDEKVASFDVPDSGADKNLSFKLTVADEKDASDSDDTTVQVEQAPNIPPKADAGDDQKAKVNDAVKLDGGKSSDADGKIVSYKWEQTDGPKIDLKNSNEKIASFDVPLKAADSKLSFKLTVADDKDASDSDNATVQVDKITQQTQESN